MYRLSLGPGETPLYDPFWTAAAHGSTDALDMILQHWAASPSSILDPGTAQGDMPLHVAAAAQRPLTTHQSFEECIRSQDAVMTALTPEHRRCEGSDVEVSLLDQPNHAGKTPKQLSKESRIMWQQQQNRRQQR